ncbi:MAG: LolA family protein [Thermoguttaceae bacterium]
MTDSEDRTVVGRLKRLSQIEPSREAIELALGHARAALTNLPTVTASRPLEPARPWKRISQWMGGLSMRQRIALGGVGAAAIVAILWLWPTTISMSVSAMEKMAENIRKAHSYKCKVTVRMKDDSPEPGKLPDREGTDTCYWLAPGSVRIDAKEDDKDWEQNRTEIFPAGKPGILIDHITKKFSREPALEKNNRGRVQSVFNDLESLGMFSGKAERELGTKEINGKEARGFQISMRKMEVRYSRPGLAEIWIDTESNLPILVRYEGLKTLNQSMTIERTEIQWNIDLDPNLFDTTPPEGYVDDTHTPKPLSLEEQVARITKSLAIYAEASGGHYPREKYVNYFGVAEDLCKMLGVAKWPIVKREGNAAKAEKAIAGIGRIGIIQNENPDAAYYGKTVGPNDKDKVLVRWKLDDGRYEVIFGDLRSETVTAEKLRALEGKL